MDDRLGAKEMVIGLADCRVGAIAYPFARMAPRAVLNHAFGDQSVLILYDDASRLAAIYERPLHEGQVLRFDADFDADAGGQPFLIRDEATGSRWNFLGEAVDGPLAGEAMRQIPTYNAFWFAWAAFNEGTALWGGE